MLALVLTRTPARLYFLLLCKTKAVTFTLTPEDLKLCNSELRFDRETGGSNRYIGTSSIEVQEARFT